MYALTIAGLSRRFDISGRSIDALDGIDLTIASGELLAVVGHSGCGKTTLLHHVAGLQRADAGTIAFEGADGPAASARSRW